MGKERREHASKPQVGASRLTTFRPFVASLIWRTSSLCQAKFALPDDRVVLYVLASFRPCTHPVVK